MCKRLARTNDKGVKVLRTIYNDLTGIKYDLTTKTVRSGEKTYRVIVSLTHRHSNRIDTLRVIRCRTIVEAWKCFKYSAYLEDDEYFKLVAIQ